MVLRVFAEACVLYSLPPQGLPYDPNMSKARTEAQVALRTNLGTNVHAEQVIIMGGNDLRSMRSLREEMSPSSVIRYGW